LFIAFTWQRFAHAWALFGAQQVSSGLQYCALGHADVPPAPHSTHRPQLFITWPHCRAPQVTESNCGAQPQTPLLQVAPPSQLPQGVGWPQLSVVIPQRLAHQLACVWHTHTLLVQASPVGQSGAQLRIWPQLSDPAPQCVLHQLGSGVQASAASDGDIASPSIASPSVVASPSASLASITVASAPSAFTSPTPSRPASRSSVDRSTPRSSEVAS
jgi:hypothetical protein